MSYLPRFAATIIAGVPYRDPREACRLILQSFPEAPGVPRLTKSMRMYLDGIPCLVADAARKKLTFDLSPEREEEFLAFHQRYDSHDLNSFAIKPEDAPGMYTLLDILKRNPPRELALVHIQTPGPITWALSVTDTKGKPAFYDETLRDLVVKALSMKAQWQEWKIRKELPNVETMVDFGEPSLLVYSSAVGTGTREDIVRTLDEIMRPVVGLKCIHCCANIDWSMLLETITDVINFDAYEYPDKLALYPDDLGRFLERGGMIAWGIVPTINEKIIEENTRTLVEKLERSIQLMVNKGIKKDKLLEASWVTPSCATSNMSVELANRAFTLTAEVSHVMRQKYFGDVQGHFAGLRA